MNLSDQELTRLFDGAFPGDAPGEDLWEATRSSIRRRVRTRRVAAVAGALAVLVLAVAVPQLLVNRPATSGVEFAPAEQPEPEPAPEPDPEPDPQPGPTDSDQPVRPSPSPSAETTPSPQPAAEAPAAPRPEPSSSPTPAAGPARVEVRDYRLVLLDENGAVVRTLYGDYDPATDGLEYGMGDVALRPGSTTRDLVVAFGEGDEQVHHLRLLVVRGGGEAQVSTLYSLNFEDTDRQYTAFPASAWSSDGGYLAWLKPDPANQPVLTGLRWSDGAPAGEATPPGGVPVDGDGVAQADGARSLRVLGWRTDPEQLVVSGYRTDGSDLSYVLPVTRAGGQLQAGALRRAG